MQGTASSYDQSTRTSAGMFQPITHSIRKAKFLCYRERYEAKLDENKNEIPGLLKTSLKVSVDQGLLLRMHFVVKLDKGAKEIIHLIWPQQI